MSFMEAPLADPTTSPVAGGDGKADRLDAKADRLGGNALQGNARPVASDEELVGRMRRKDGSAGEELVRRYYLPLVRYLQRLSGSDQLAEELHQQTWVSVLEHLDRFDPAGGAGGFKAWLFRIATNKANDFWRSSGRDKAAREGLRLVKDEEAPSAMAGPQGAEEAAKLQRAIQRLPEPQREVLLLRYYADMKFVDIAKLLGCPLNTALGRMHKAMLKLKQLMDDDASRDRAGATGEENEA